MLQLKNEPTFQNFLQYFTTFVEAALIGPDARKTGNFTETGSILEQLIASPCHGLAAGASLLP